jgi:hypothetical protein
MNGPLAASNSGASADGILTVILGLAVALVLAGIIVRTIVRRRSTRSSTTPTANDSRDPASIDAPAAVHSVVEGLADVPEPELMRLTSETLAPFARTLDRARRLRSAEERVARELESLPAGFWLLERYVLVSARRIPFLVAGPTGVFLICATDGAWTPDDLHVLADAAAEVRDQLPGYEGGVHAAVCMAFDEMEPRSWYGGTEHEGRGGWVMGVDWLKKWLFSFGPEHGLLNGDVRRLDEASGPFWDRRTRARLPEGRNLG